MTPDSGGRLLFLVRDSRYFLSHRLPLVEAAIANGYKVAVGCSLLSEKDRSQLSGLGVEVFSVPFIQDMAGNRGLRSILFGTQRAIYSFDPDVIHAITIRSIAVGALFNFLTNRPFVALFAGLGTLFRTEELKFRRLKVWLIATILKVLLSRKLTRVVFMNDEDRDIFVNHTSVSHEMTLVIKGSGIDLHKFVGKNYSMESESRTVVMTARLLRDKGVYEYLRAAEILKDSADPVQFVLAGDVDVANPTSLSRIEVEDLCRRSGVKWIGYCSDVTSLLAEADIFCLPSYHEGLSLSVLEAAASQLAIVTSDIAGCRAILENEKEGLLVEPRNAAALASAIQYLLRHPKEAAAMAKAARVKAETEFSSQTISTRYLALYNSLWSGSDMARGSLLTKGTKRHS